MLGDISVMLVRRASNTNHENWYQSSIILEKKQIKCATISRYGSSKAYEGCM